MGKPTRGRGAWWRQAVNVKHWSPAGTRGRRGWVLAFHERFFDRPMDELALHTAVDFFKF